MRYRPFYTALIFFSFVAASLQAEDSLLAGFPRAPFSRGVNLTSWFDAPSAHSITFSRYTREDLASLKALGVDVVRLPIRLHSMTLGAPDWKIDPLLFRLLDTAVDWAEALGIPVILDNHSFNPQDPTRSSDEAILTAVWRQMAEHYRSRSSLVYYEILNEPHGIDAEVWGAIQGRVIDSIRAIDQRHAIVVGGVDFNSYRALADLPRYADGNLVYTFHFYDPFFFTHQGATWVEPSMDGVKDIPFPPDARPIPPIPDRYLGSWIDSNRESYPADGQTRSLEESLDLPVAFARERQVRVFCGEFGVFIPNARPAERVVWYRTVRSLLEKRGVPWTMWDCRGAFGLFNTSSGGDFSADLNLPLVGALGFKPLAQKKHSVTKKPIEADFTIYGDYVEAGIQAGGWSRNGTADFYSTEMPHSGSYALSWSGAERWSAISLDFDKPIDLSALKGTGAIEFWARTQSPRMSFDIRLQNPGGGEGELPWRMSFTVGANILPSDGTWHLIRIPLSSMKDTGAWKDVWHESAGLFDWTRIGCLQIASEVRGLEGTTVWFDDVKIVSR